jgi:hypothetical protein
MEAIMKYFIVIVTIILFISLIINFTISSKLTQVENQLMNVSNNQQEIMSSINGQEHHIRSVMDDIQKQQSWISEITMNVNTKKSPNDEIMAQFHWQIKEQSRDSKVMFHYALGEQDTFTSIAVGEQANGIYQIEVPLRVHLEPRWEITLSEQESENTNSILDEKRKEEASQQTMRYFISLTNSVVVKNSEINTFYLGDLGIETFGVISVNLDHSKEQSALLVTTYQTGIIEKVQLLTYENETLLDEQKLKREFEHYILEELDLKNSKQFVLRVTYKDGNTFEKVIYE